MRPTATARQRDHKTFYRYSCLRGHTHRTAAVAIRCDQAFSRKVKRDVEATRKRLGFDHDEKGEQTCSN